MLRFYRAHDLLLNGLRSSLLLDIPICIALARQLGLPHEHLRRVKGGHHDLDKLDLLCARKRLIIEQFAQLSFVRNCVALRFDCSVVVERAEDIRVLPIGDIVILAVLSVNIALDGVPAVVKHEDDGF